MRETEPKVYLIAEPKIRWQEVERYLTSIGAVDWLHRIADIPAKRNSDAETLVEFAGRGCYRSWQPGLNANVTKVREDTKAYLRNIIDVGHGSVMEHAQFTFVFQDVSRVFTHELVRHRAGVAISQESLRYVRLTDLGFRVPEILEGHRDAVIDIVERLEEFQVAAADAFGLDDDTVPFEVKKEVTSALRRLAPLGLSTMMTWSANIRTLRHVIEMRTSRHAEEEIRTVFHSVARTMKAVCPMLFDDYEINDHGEWIPSTRKV